MDTAFITGSSIYGTMHKDSDIDIVVLMPKPVLEHLMKYSDNQYVMRFGKLNILGLDAANTTHVNFYDVWMKVTKDLIARKPVTREQAIQARKDAGIGNLPDGAYLYEEN